MKKFFFLLLLVVVAVNLLWLNTKVIKGINYNQKQSDKSEEDDEFCRTTSDSLKRSYQQVNTALIGFKIEPKAFSGPHHGAGVITSRSGSLFTIKWDFDKTEKDPNEPPTQRALPFSSILCIDRPLGGTFADTFVVYYKGPFGDTEFAFLFDGEFAKGFIDRWKSLWLSQEP